MILPLAFILAVLPHFAAAYLDPPPSTAAPDTIEDCSNWRIATDTDTCASISKYGFLTEAQFSTYNPSVADGCELVVGNSYCIETNWGIPEPTSTISSSATSTSQTPTPISSAALAACEAESSGYNQYCARCASRCTNEAWYSACFENTFRTINYYDSQCWQRGGIDCVNQAVDIVCPRK